MDRESLPFPDLADSTIAGAKSAFPLYKYETSRYERFGCCKGDGCVLGWVACGTLSMQQEWGNGGKEILASGGDGLGFLYLRRSVW